jgi:hypothetical protein
MVSMTVNVVAILVINTRKSFRMRGVTDVTYIIPIGKTRTMNSKVVLYGIVAVMVTISLEGLTDKSSMPKRGKNLRRFDIVNF